MSEFSFSDIQRWMNLAFQKDCSIQCAIYYDLYFEIQTNAAKLERAVYFFKAHLIEKYGYIES